MGLLRATARRAAAAARRGVLAQLHLYHSGLARDDTRKELPILARKQGVQWKSPRAFHPAIPRGPAQPNKSDKATCISKRQLTSIVSGETSSPLEVEQEADHSSRSAGGGRKKKESSGKGDDDFPLLHNPGSSRGRKFASRREVGAWARLARRFGKPDTQAWIRSGGRLGRHVFSAKWLAEVAEPAVKLYNRTFPEGVSAQLPLPDISWLVEVARSMRRVTAGMEPWSVTNLTLGLYLLSLRHAAEGAADVIGDSAVTDRALVKQLLYFVEVASGAACNSSAAVARATMVRQDRIMKLIPQSGFMQPAHFIAVDDRKRLVVLSIRGTRNAYDLLTNATSHPHSFAQHGANRGSPPGRGCPHDWEVPREKREEEGKSGGFWGGGQQQGDLGTLDRKLLRGAYGHYGIAQAAKWILDTEVSTLRALLAEYPGYKLCIVGHSLGGAVGTVLAIMLHHDSYQLLGVPPADVACIGISTPPCVSRELAVACSSFVTTLVLQDDVIPRISPEALGRLRSEILLNDWSAKLNEGGVRGELMELVASTFNSTASWRFKGSPFAPAGNPPPVPRSASAAESGEPCQGGEGLAGTVDAELRDLGGDANPEGRGRFVDAARQSAPQLRLFSPGRLYHLLSAPVSQVAGHRGESLQEALRSFDVAPFASSGRQEADQPRAYVLVTAPPEARLGRIVLSDSMFSDHRIGAISHALREVLKVLD